MTERGMIFNAEMVRAILAGRKTQTRRIMAPQPEPCPRGGHWWPSNVFKTMLHVEDEMQNGKGCWGGLVGDACPFGDVGDRIWVRETFQGPLFNYEQMDEYLEDSSKFEKPEFCQYAADGGHRPEYQDADDNLRHGWRPSIHMPRWASRILLEITNVRVERLNSMHDVDAMREGIQNLTTCLHSDFGIPGVVNAQHPVRAFQLLWESIYGIDSWHANPWVWVIEFKRVEGGAA
ncbi:morphogenetic protein [Klebsiella pneumoniae]|uniref:morphogenetic protein n=1 Tax=Klebsiella sp. C387 TaxID=3409947 RepID=UPI001CE03C8B|nr:morphogenetic protein [Klebsiella pneumoniae]HBQ6986557.1 morphogenetic protein [Klebsiella quasipneumoniae subsp. similipneumoniae]MCA5301614.1 morphogenetic protein [Klebsiella pneumoniae]MCA5306975.1 morphogenetic protein [Klebsiella pneumoniae]MCA5312094.1 morphogenetic protein [Klebsiella pneumoniae]